MDLDQMRLDCAVKQKKGLHFILASVVIWCALILVHASRLPVMTKNLMTFCCTAPLMPLAYMISKAIKVDFQNKDNPLTKLGILFSVNQILYLLIAMWIYAAIPDKMLMVMAMIFGAHLLPFGWLYRSKTYMALSFAIPVLSLAAGLHFQAYVLAAIMAVIEILFSLMLIAENRKLASQISAAGM